MKIFQLKKVYNKHDESDWASVNCAEDLENEDFDAIEWDTHCGATKLSEPVPVSLSIEMPIPDFCIFNMFSLGVFNYKSDRIQTLFENSNVEWIPCKIVASYDEDTADEIPLAKEQEQLELGIVNPLTRCKLAPGAAIERVNDDGYWNQIEAIDNLSLYEDELAKSDIFTIESSPLVFCSVAFKKKAQELKITGIGFERIATLTS